MEIIHEKARGTSAWKKLERYMPVSAGHRAERALAQHLADLAFQRKVAKAVERRPEVAAKEARETRVKRWAAKAANYSTYWDFEMACLAEIPRDEKGAARDKAIAEAAIAWNKR